MTVSPSTVTEMQGSSVEAVCQATGSPPPDIQWNLDMLSTQFKVSRSPLALLRAPPFLLFLLANASLGDRWQMEPADAASGLILSDLSPDDNGRVIVCSAENVVGKSEATLQLDIHCKACSAAAASSADDASRPPRARARGPRWPLRDL